MSKPQKACPVVTRVTEGRIEVLAFRHPTAGYQLVKGTIELDETVQHAAERELFEESGIAGAAIDYLGVVQMEEPAQDWHFVLCRTGPLNRAWTHRTIDGGGLDFEFFWHPLADDADENWHPIFRRALAFIGEQATKLV
jgi:8-oxo-dGTP pyrophosphatase MutT (NUDIX family)